MSFAFSSALADTVECTVTIRDNTADNGGGGGLGAGIIHYNMSLSPGIPQKLGLSIGDNVAFTVAGEVHTLRISYIAMDSAELTISSDPIKVVLKIGDIKHFDLNKDGIDDLEIELISTAENSATLILMSLSNIIEVVVTPSAQLSEPVEHIAQEQVQPEANNAITGSLIAIPEIPLSIDTLVLIIMGIVLMVTVFIARRAIPCAKNKCVKPRRLWR